MQNFPIERPYEFGLVQAMWTLGKFPRELLPDVAAEAMVGGYDGPAVLALASFHPPLLDGIEKSVELAFQEMGLLPLGRLQAAVKVARYLARRVVAGKTGAVVWCKAMGDYWTNEPNGATCRELGELYGLWLSFDEYPEDRMRTLRSMKEKAREWLTE